MSTFVGSYTVHVSRSSGARYYYNATTKESVWHSDDLPHGWAWGKDGGEEGPKYYRNLLTSEKCLEVPQVAATATAPMQSEKRRRQEEDSEGAPALRSPKRTKEMEPKSADLTAAAKVQQVDSPLMSLVRQEWMSWHHRKLAAAVAAHWPLQGDSKTVRSCKSEGLLPGLQGIHARFLFGQLQAQIEPVDPLLPHAPDCCDSDFVKELIGMGVPSSAAQQVASDLALQMAKAAKSCAAVSAELHKQSESKPEMAGNAASPQRGTLYLLPAPADNTADREISAGQGPRRYLVVYQPSDADVKHWLAPVRAAAAVPKAPFSGPLNLPLYLAAADKPMVQTALQAAGIKPSPFTSALELNASHYRKLALLFRLTSAGVEDVALLPAVGAPGCQLSAVGMLGTGQTLPNPDQSFLRHVYCLLARYETFAGNTSGLQGAVPHHVFDVLETAAGATRECFASPLNCHFPRFCSAFPDTDSVFGSLGSFFDYDFGSLGGYYECNPPFVNETMLSMSQALHRHLHTASTGGKELLFFVIVPAWTDALFYQTLQTSPFLRCSAQLGRKQHDYIDGMQHRVDRSVWGANVDSTWFILATQAAVAAKCIGHHTVDVIHSVYASPEDPSKVTAASVVGHALPRVHKYPV